MGEACLIDMIPTSPSINVPGNGHSVSTGLTLTQKQPHRHNYLCPQWSEAERVNGHLIIN
jgi:hypothetical protein